MRQLITILFCLWTLASCSQKRLDYGAIRANPDFTCTDTAIESYCKLDKICNSENEIEIRLEALYEPLADFALYVLANNDSAWTVTRYSRSTHRSTNDTAISIVADTLNNRRIVERLIDTLKQNDVFALPDQDDLKINGYVDDGDNYTLTFKVGRKFRSYNFNNPDIYKEDYRQMKEFKNYSNIVNAFYNAFSKK